MDSFDFKMRKPEQVRNAVMAKLKKFGKGIVLMHDFQQATAAATADLLNDLKAGGYKIVHMRAALRSPRSRPMTKRSARTPSCRPLARSRPRAWCAPSTNSDG